MLPTTVEQFREQGYVVLPSLVHAADCLTALRLINMDLGTGIPPESLSIFEKQSFCLTLRDHPDILRLAWAPRQVISTYLQLLPTTSCQIAIRFPTDGASWVPHMDGVLYGEAKHPVERIISFNCLAGVMLSDQSQPGMGNLVVYPGTHYLMAKTIKKHGEDWILKNGLHEAFKHFEMPKPVEICGEIGSVVLCNYLLLHNTGINKSHSLRYNVYFRLEEKQHRHYSREALRDPWYNWKFTGV